MTSRRVALAAGTVLVAAAAVAVAIDVSSEAQPPSVAQRWAEGISALNIDPVYPPREDIHVGDIFLAYEDPNPNNASLRYRRRSILLDSLPGYPEVVATQFYAARRPALPRSIGPASRDNARSAAWPFNTAPLPVPGTGSQDAVLAHVTPMARLRAAAFPGYTVARITVADLGLGGAYERVKAALGLGTRGQAAISMSIPSAEHYAAPAIGPQGLIAAFNWYVDCFGASLTRPELERLMRMSSNVVEPLPEPTIIVVQEVFYTRSIDYHFENAAVLQAAANVIVVQPPAQSPEAGGAAGAAGSAANQPAAQPARPGGGAAPAVNPPPASDAGAAVMSAATLQAQLDAITARIGQRSAEAVDARTPAVQVSFGRASGQSMTLTQNFDYPVAIGYRGLRFRAPRANTLPPSPPGDCPAIARAVTPLPDPAGAPPQGPAPIRGGPMQQ